MGTSVETRPPLAFIVHGRDLQARAALDTCLRSMQLDVEPFEEIADGMAAMPVISSVLEHAIDRADVVVVLFTPDEQAVLFDPVTGRYDARDHTAARWQARANVIFEAGWAFGKKRDRTVFVSVGAATTLFTDVAGHHTIRLDIPGGKEQLRRRLETVLDRSLSLPPGWASSAESGDFQTCVRARWRYHDELGEMLAKLANMDLERFNLLRLLQEVMRAHPDWSWMNRVPRDLIMAIDALTDPDTTDNAYWWLASIGFFRFSDIEYWGDDWEDSIDIASFAPRSAVFLEWLRGQPLLENLTLVPPRKKSKPEKRKGGRKPRESRPQRKAYGIDGPRRPSRRG